MATFTFSEGSLTLNEEQAAIVRQPPSQSMRILASAGSGKTTTLTARIAHLLTVHGAAPAEIVLLTFTHNAAAVMRQRLAALVGSQRILCGTFHALSQQILREHAPDALNDLYHVDSTSDVVLESADQGQDSVIAVVNYTLSDHVETLVLEGKKRTKSVLAKKTAVLSVRLDANVVQVLPLSLEYWYTPSDVALAAVPAEVMATPLKVLAPLLCSYVAPGGHLVLAGILERQAEELQAAYSPWVALEVADTQEGWILMTAQVLARPA
jgi:hypothetical protein